jgi:hypothetical protein
MAGCTCIDPRTYALSALQYQPTDKKNKRPPCKTLINSAIRLMNRLSFGVKFCLISALLILTLLATSVTLALIRRQ